MGILEEGVLGRLLPERLGLCDGIDGQETVSVIEGGKDVAAAARRRAGKFGLGYFDRNFFKFLTFAASMYQA